MRGKIGAMGVVAVFAALRPEVSPLRALLSGARLTSQNIPIYIGEINGVEIILVRSGVGRKRALAAAEIVWDRYTPEAVLSTGFCGGLVPGLRSSEIILSAWIHGKPDASPSEWKRISLRHHATPALRALHHKGIEVRAGGFVCVSRPVISVSQRSALARATGGIIAEMETFHLGSFFVPRDIPFLGLRTVVDSLEEQISERLLPTRLGSLPLVARISSSLLHHRGGGFIPFWRLYKQGRMAQATLAKAVASVIGSWPPQGPQSYIS
jgi:adenosylhomocysteine nucleosidase